jgi:type IV pilus assembly protein PilA
VAIIGILAAVALPQYQTYTIKAKVTQLVSSLDNVKSCISEQYTSNITAMAGVSTLCSIASNALFPAITPAEKGVTQVLGAAASLGAAVSATMTNNFSDVSATGGNLVWECKGEPAKYFPPGCRA